MLENMRNKLNNTNIPFSHDLISSQMNAIHNNVHPLVILLYVKRVVDALLSPSLKPTPILSKKLV